MPSQLFEDDASANDSGWLTTFMNLAATVKRRALRPLGQGAQEERCSRLTRRRRRAARTRRMARPTIHRFWREAALPFVESRRANDSSACYAPHAHDALSIGAVDGGSSVLCRDGRRRRLTRGDVVLIAAGEVHSCNPRGRWSLELPDALSRQRLGARRGRRAGRVIGLVGINRLRRTGHRATARERRGATPAADGSPDSTRCSSATPRRPTRKRRWCSSSATSTVSHHQLRRGRPATPGSSRLRRVQELIEHNCEQALRLDELASAAQMSRYQLLRAFRQAFGMTPHAWQVDLRIQRARRLLDQGMSLADAALQLGFADQSHFQRAFKERVAATPGEYRRGRAESS